MWCCVVVGCVSTITCTLRVPQWSVSSCCCAPIFASRHSHSDVPHSTRVTALRAKAMHADDLHVHFVNDMGGEAGYLLQGPIRW